MPNYGMNSYKPAGLKRKYHADLPHSSAQDGKTEENEKEEDVDDNFDQWYANIK